MQQNARTEIARTQTKLILGRWNHPSLGKRQVGEIDFGPQAELDLPDQIIQDFVLIETDGEDVVWKLYADRAEIFVFTGPMSTKWVFGSARASRASSSTSTFS